jgi:hypothetical protein
MTRRFVTPDTFTPPPGTPLIEPAEAVAIALSTSRLGRSYSPESLVVRLVLQAISRSGWKIVPIDTAGRAA